MLQNIVSICIQTVYEILYRTFLLLASNLNRIWNILQIKMGEQAYLFGTNLYRLVFTCFNFRSVRTVSKNKPSVSCTRFIFIYMCLLKAAPLTKKQAEFNEISHLSRVGLPPPQTYRHPPHLRTPRPHHLSSSRRVRARNRPCGPVRSPLPPCHHSQVHGHPRS